MSAHERDAEDDDRFLDLCLHEQLGGVQAPDLARTIATASGDRLARAAAHVDRAATAGPRPRWRTPLAMAAAALVVLGGLAWGIGLFPVSPPPERLVTFQDLIEAFHRAMPPYPALLRDAERRPKIAAKALPVVRRILDRADALPPLPPSPRGLHEFEVYAVVLGDAGLAGDLERRAAGGDAAAAGVLAIARAVVDDGEPRRLALEDLATALTLRPDLAPGFAQAVAAADLSVAEAERLAPAFADAALAQGLVRSAALAAQSPSHRLGQRIDLSGRLVDDTLFRDDRLRGRVVLVCFWASWCRPSVAALERIRRLAAHRSDLTVVAVSCDHDPEAVIAYAAEHDDARWIYCFDRQRPGWHELARAYGVSLLPTVLLLDRGGVLRDAPLLEELEDAVARQLGR
ncbi:MAG: TlpA family protein disulfide reductase [Planctomycetes bacterium]|nr:TlpA family protein disulfide reductase [Planctomycetota bacterium]